MENQVSERHQCEAITVATQRRCSNRASFNEGGKWFCGQHYPNLNFNTSPLPMKLVGDEEIDGVTSFSQWYEFFTTMLNRKPDNAERNSILFMKKATAQAQLLADQRVSDGMTKELIDALKDMTDSNPCRFDHEGYCQEHGWLQSGECPHSRAKKLIARYGG